MTIVRYQREDEVVPVTEWLNSLTDKTAQANVRIRIRTMEAGCFGDSKPVGEGVNEARIHIGAGYRLYYARHGKEIVVLLCGGDKSSQAKDIKLAKQYFANWKMRQKK